MSGISSVRSSTVASSPPAVSRNQYARPEVLMVIQYFSFECLYTLPSSTMLPSAFTTAP